MESVKTGVGTGRSPPFSASAPTETEEFALSGAFGRAWVLAGLRRCLPVQPVRTSQPPVKDSSRRRAGTVKEPSRPSLTSGNSPYERPMTDVLYVLITLAAFMGLALLVGVLDREKH